MDRAVDQRRDPLDTSTNALVAPMRAIEVRWTSFVLSVICLVAAYFGTAPNYEPVWPITKALEGIYGYPTLASPNTHTPTWALFVWVGVLALLVGCGEALCHSARGKTLKWRLRTLDQMLYFVETVVLITFVTQLGKTFVSEPRPDFIARCLHAAGESADAAARFDTDGRLICDTTDKDVEEGMLSFPSGHASLGVGAGLYCTLHLLWLLYARSPGPFRLLQRTRQVLALGCLVPLFSGCYIAAGRVVDHRHSPADVAAGALVGSVIAIVQFSRGMAGVYLRGGEYLEKVSWGEGVDRV